MTMINDQQHAANFMGALAQLLGGRPGRHAEFIGKVELIVSGSEPDAMQLMQFAGRCRITGRPLLWVHVSPESPRVPQIGLVVADGDQTRIFENCMLWTGTDGDRARLVPDNFRSGAYRFDDGLRLRHSPAAPARSLKAAEPGIVRACRRLVRLERGGRLGRGGTLPLPELAKAA